MQINYVYITATGFHFSATLQNASTYSFYLSTTKVVLAATLLMYNNKPCGNTQKPQSALSNCLQNWKKSYQLVYKAREE